MPKAKITPLGLQSGVNDILTKPGACQVAQNVVFGPDGSLTPRWGWQLYGSGTLATGTPLNLRPFNSDVYFVKSGSALLYKASDNTSLSLFNGYEPALYYPQGPMWEARGRLYYQSVNATGGNSASIGTSSTVTVPCGISPPPPVLKSGHTSSFSEIPANSSYGVRSCVSRTYPEGLAVRSPPSSPAYIQAVSSSHRVTLIVGLPPEAVAGDMLEVYRTLFVEQEMDGSTQAECTEPVGADYFLWHTVAITSTMVTNGYATIGGATGALGNDSTLGAALYTNPSVEGEELSNFRQPSGTSAAVYKGCVFVGAAKSPEKLTVCLHNVAGRVPDQWSGAGAYNAGGGAVFTDNDADTYADAFDFNGDAVPEGIGVWHADGAGYGMPPSSTVSLVDASFVRVGQVVTARGTTDAPAGWAAGTDLRVTNVSGANVTLSAAHGGGGGTVNLDFHDVLEIAGVEVVAHTTFVRSTASANGLAYFQVDRTKQAATWWTADLEKRKAVHLYLTAQAVAYAWTMEMRDNAYGGFAITPGDPFVPESAGTVVCSKSYFASVGGFGTAGVNSFNLPGSTSSAYAEDYVKFPNLYTGSGSASAKDRDQNDYSGRALAWSKQDQPEHYPLLYQTALGEPVRALAATEDVLYVFTARATYALSGDGPSSGWTLEQISPSDDSGLYLLDRSAVLAYGDTVYALTNQGMLTLRGGQIAKIDQALPQEIRRFVMSSTRSSYTIALGYHPVYETLLVSLQLAPSISTSSKSVFAYATATGQWSTHTIPEDRGINGGRAPWVPYAYTILNSRLFYLAKTAAATGSAIAADSIGVFASREWTTSTTQEDVLHHLDQTTSDASVVVSGSSSPYTLSGLDDWTQAGDVLVAPNGTYCFVTSTQNGLATVLASATPDNGTYTRYSGYSCRLKFFPLALDEHGEYKQWRTVTLAWDQYRGISGSQRRTYAKVDYHGHNGATASGSYSDLSTLPICTFFVPAAVCRLPTMGPDLYWYPWNVAGLSALDVSYVVTEKGKAGWRR